MSSTFKHRDPTFQTPSASLPIRRKFGSATSGNLLIGLSGFPVKIEDGHVISSREINGRVVERTVLGKLVRVVSTSGLRETDAQRVPGAELVRMKGKLKDPSLQIIQLTDAFREYSDKFAIYKPQTPSQTESAFQY